MSRWIRLLSHLVPAGRRREWCAEWEGELWAFEQKTDEQGESSRVRRAWFALGALPHSLAELTSSWSPDLLGRDLRYAARSLLRSRGFTLTSVMLLAVGVSGSATVYSIVAATLLRAPVGVSAPKDLLQIGRATSSHTFDNWSHGLYDDFVRESRLFDGIAAYGTTDLLIGRGLSTEQVTGQAVSANYFTVLGAELQRGPGFSPKGLRSEAVISHTLWQRRFGAAPDVIGQTLEVTGQPFEIAAVTRPGFFGADVGAPAPDVWIPLTQQSVLGGHYEVGSRRMSWLSVVGRARPEIQEAALERELGLILSAGEAGEPSDRRSRIALSRGLGLHPEDQPLAKRVSALMAGGVIFVLLIACSNLAALLLARGAARRGELGIRLALGASQARLIRQLLIESALVSAAGSVIAFGISYALSDLVTALFPWQIGPSLKPDGGVLAFALALGVGTSIAFSLAPALHAVRVDVSQSLQFTGTRASWRQGPWRMTLVAMQIALSFTLLFGAGLMLRTLSAATSRSPGFRTEGVTLVELPFILTDSANRAASAVRFHAVVNALSGTEGIQRVGFASGVPGSGALENGSVWRSEAPPTTELPPTAYRLAVDTGYFGMMRIGLERGRSFDQRDVASAPRVVVVSRTLATRLWGSADPIGRSLSIGSFDGEGSATVIGVARDIRNRSLRAAPAPQLYLPFAQQTFTRPILYLEADSWDGAVERTVQEVVQTHAHGLPPIRPEPIQQRIGQSLSDVRLIARMGSLFGIIALLLAVSGLYGVIAYAVSMRAREFAVRLALGAAPSQIVGLVLRQGATLVMAGVAAGCAGALLVAQALRGMLFNVSAFDLTTFAIVTLILVTAALLANLISAWRSTRVQPTQTLRPF